MSKPISNVELLRMVLACFAAYSLWSFAGGFVVQRLGPIETEADLVLVIALGGVLPPFLSVVTACLLPPWRTKTIAATIMLMGVAVIALVDLALSLGGWESALWSVVRMSVAMTGALVGVLTWRGLKKRHHERPPTSSVAAAPADGAPRPSTIALALALASVPATYLTLVVSVLVAIGYSTIAASLLTSVGSVPIVILIALVLAPLACAWASLSALRAVIRPEPGFQAAEELDLANRPRLSEIVGDVCERLQTRMPDHVILHATPTFFVTQDRLRTFDGVLTGRTLAVGMPLLPYLTAQELKSILAHEFAHFTGHDTLYSVWVAQVYRGLGQSIESLGGIVAGRDGAFGAVMSLLLLPSLLVLSVFHEFFASIDALVDRAREQRADWIASDAYGSAAFVSALQKTAKYGGHFDEHQNEVSLDNPDGLFRQYRALVERDAGEVDQYLAVALATEATEFDSHPSLRTRLASVPVHVPVATDDGCDLSSEMAPDEQRLSDALVELLRRMRGASGQRVAPEPLPVPTK